MVLHDVTTYPGGYLDGKYSSPSFIKKVAEMGSEPARWAFDGAQVLFNRNEGRALEEAIRAAPVYTAAEKSDRQRRFRAQLEIWAWYTTEAIKKEKMYLLHTAVSKLILFGGRLILSHNELLYPCHKWFLRVLEGAPQKPEALMACIDDLASEPTLDKVQAFAGLIKGFQDVRGSVYGGQRAELAACQDACGGYLNLGELGMQHVTAKAEVVWVTMWCVW